ncbi:unnamed protein product [Adineta steineri]|uniref:Uncharacterized protein n=1 Tax=Adineta steineri TaxID=433720 RepID=A0A815MKW6_9BILA|nr:unnamed protein product [Adineta steineri]CAF1621592.1 unnamed protein product [Adineta steineri]
MSDFGQCSDPLCTKQDVRLFDCAHHCMRLVCLQHLIEHDRLIDQNQDYSDKLRCELKQLWTTYSLLIDETKLRLEYEQKLEKHQQLVQDVTNLFEYDFVNIERYHSVLEILKQNIEQGKQLNQNSSTCALYLEKIKNEPLDNILTTNEHNFINVNEIYPRFTEKFTDDDDDDKLQKQSILNNGYAYQVDNITQNNITNNSMQKYRSIRKMSGKCPFWLDGSFGLTENFHGMYLCSHGRYYQDFFRHLLKFHQLTLSATTRICHAIQNDEDSITKILFQPNDIVIDRTTRFRCPFSIYNSTSSIKPTSNERHCRRDKPQLAYTLRCHLIRFHRMKTSNANKLICRSKANLKHILN